ncbi:MAG: hypothetical protein ACYDDF_15350 [Thermoplasmatota archaeon]
MRNRSPMSSCPRTARRLVNLKATAPFPAASTLPVDPVCDESFSEREAEELGAERLEWKGQTLWFCGPYCRHEFEKSPDRYASKVAKAAAGSTGGAHARHGPAESGSAQPR